MHEAKHHPRSARSAIDLVDASGRGCCHADTVRPCRPCRSRCRCQHAEHRDSVRAAGSDRRTAAGLSCAAGRPRPTALLERVPGRFTALDIGGVAAGDRGHTRRDRRHHVEPLLAERRHRSAADKELLGRNGGRPQSIDLGLLHAARCVVAEQPLRRACLHGAILAKSRLCQQSTDRWMSSPGSSP